MKEKMRQRYMKFDKSDIDKLIMKSIKQSVKDKMIAPEIDYNIDGSIIVTWIEDVLNVKEKIE